MIKAEEKTWLQSFFNWLEEYASLISVGSGFLIAIGLIIFKTSLPQPAKFLGDDYTAYFVGVWWTLVGMTLDTIFQKKKTQSYIENISSKTDELAKMTKSLVIAKKDLGELTPVRLSISNFSKFFPYLAVYVAIHLGLFEEEDLSVELARSSGDDSLAIDALRDGQSDFAITDPAMAIPYHDHCQIIAPILSKAALWGISKRPIVRDAAHKVTTSQFQTIVTYPKHTTAYRLVNSWVGTSGPKVICKDRKDLLTEMEALLDEHSLVVVTEPEKTYHMSAISGISTNVIDLHDELYASNLFNFTAIISTNGNVSANEGIVRRLCRALRLAYSLIYSAQPGTALYTKIIAAAMEHSISAYPEIISKLNEQTCGDVLEALKRGQYFSRDIFYDEHERQGLVNAFNLHSHDKGFPGTSVLVDKMLYKHHASNGRTN